jgi:hypothetical protein
VSDVRGSVSGCSAGPTPGDSTESCEQVYGSSTVVLEHAGVGSEILNDVKVKGRFPPLLVLLN